jgi:hypothetical protein
VADDEWEINGTFAAEHAVAMPPYPSIWKRKRRPGFPSRRGAGVFRVRILPYATIRDDSIFLSAAFILA